MCGDLLLDGIKSTMICEVSHPINQSLMSGIVLLRDTLERRKTQKRGNGLQLQESTERAKHIAVERRT